MFIEMMLRERHVMNQQKKKIHYWGGMILLLLATSACKNFHHTNKQTVIVETPMVEGAMCLLTNNIGDQWRVFDTPQTTTISVGHGPMTIQCEKQGYKKTIVQIQERYPHEMPYKEYQYMIKSALNVTRDITQDIGKAYPNVLVVLMEPRTFSDEQEKIDWLAAKQSYEKMYQEPNRSDRLVELLKQDRDLEEHLLQRQLEEEVTVNRQQSAENFIARQRQLQQNRKNIESYAQERQSMRRKILNDYRSDKAKQSTAKKNLPLAIDPAKKNAQESINSLRKILDR